MHETGIELSIASDLRELGRGDVKDVNASAN